MLDKAEAPIENAFQFREIMVALAFSRAEMDGRERRERKSSMVKVYDILAKGFTF